MKKKYITVKLKNLNILKNTNEVEISIIQETKKNNKIISYGVSFYVVNNTPNTNIPLYFESKIENLEDNKIYPRIFTGKKWITLDTELSENYKQIKIRNYFDFKSKSQWRLSSTSTKVGQKIFFNNIRLFAL